MDSLVGGGCGTDVTAPEDGLLFIFHLTENARYPPPSTIFKETRGLEPLPFPSGFSIVPPWSYRGRRARGCPDQTTYRKSRCIQMADNACLRRFTRMHRSASPLSAHGSATSHQVGESTGRAPWKCFLSDEGHSILAVARDGDCGTLA